MTENTVIDFTNGRQTLAGTDGGEDLLRGENGDDELHGLDGADWTCHAFVPLQVLV